MSEASQNKTSLILLGLGAALGLGLAAASLFTVSSRTSSDLPPGVAARVNETSISMEDYGRALTAFEADRRGASSPQERAFVLDRLIEEELLVQRGITIGLSDNDRSVRSALVQSMISTITAENTARSFDDAELGEFYAKNTALFAGSPRLRVRLYRFTGEQQAQETSARLSGGEPIDRIAKDISIKPDLLVPDALLPPHKLRQYVGPTAMQVALRLEPGEFSQALNLTGASVLMQMIDKQYTDVPAFEDIKVQVEMAYRKYRDDEALRDYLNWLKKQADIKRTSTDE